MNKSSADRKSFGTFEFQIPNQPVKQIPIEKGQLTFGRAPGNDIIIDHPTVSRHHARLTLQANSATLEDLNSSNGTFVGSERLAPYKPQKLTRNQPFWLGHVQITLQRPPLIKSFVPYYFAGASGIIIFVLLCLCVGGGLAYSALRNRRAAVVYQCDQAVMSSLVKAGPDLLSSPQVTAAILPTSIQETGVTGITATSPGAGPTSDRTQPTTAGQAPTAAQPTSSGGGQPTAAEAATEAPQPTSGGEAPTAAAATESLPGTVVSTQVEASPTTGTQPTTGGAAPTAIPPTSGGPLAQGPEEAATRSAAETYAAITPAPFVLAQSQPVTGIAFLDLPFPFDGGNVNFGGTQDQFKSASQRKGSGGRINSYFDHFFPLYPGSKKPDVPGGEEPVDSPVGDNILTFDGFLSSREAYSGHPAYDFSTFEFRQPTTPVFAAADGVIFSVGEHKQSGALFVRIKHTVPGVGDFLTIYWHLHPDKFYQTMLGREGQPITAGTRIGTMGNTGWSTGHHLHFEVRFDRNGDGVFSNHEVVDPYGWIPSAEYPDDPWFDSSKLQSLYLWRQALGVIMKVPENGGGEVLQPVDTGGIFSEDEENSICAEPGTFPPGGTVYWSWAPDPAREVDKVGTGNGCVVSVTDAQGKLVDRFEPPLKVGIYFKEEQLTNIDPATLAIYWLAPGSTEWTRLDTAIDRKRGIAAALTDRPGKCALIGKPTVDMIPPSTEIEATGPQGADGTFYDEVTITLNSSDPSGVAKTEYSLDGGSTWQDYDGPFTLHPKDIPAVIPMNEEFFGGTPGNFLILAVSTDGAGNLENPPAYSVLAINPSKDPKLALAQTPPATQTPVSTVTPTPSPSVTPTLPTTVTDTPSPSSALACTLSLTFTKNSFCRKGPGTVYDDLTALKQGVNVIVDGRNKSSTWWWIKLPDSTAHCWVSAANATIDNNADTSCLQVLRDPPTPTKPPSPTNTKPPPATTTQPPPPTTQPPATTPPDTTPPNPPSWLRPDNTTYSCTTGTESISLAWEAVSDYSGISYYVIEMEDTNYPPSWGNTRTYTSKTNGITLNLSCPLYYRYRVLAVDGAGNSGSYSNYATFDIMYTGIGMNMEFWPAN